MARQRRKFFLPSPKSLPVRQFTPVSGPNGPNSLITKAARPVLSRFAAARTAVACREFVGEAYCPAANTAGYRNIAPHGACRAPASVKSASETSGKRWTRDFSKSHCVSCGSERPHISSATSCGAAKSRNGGSQGSRPVLSRFAAARTAVACREFVGEAYCPAANTAGYRNIAPHGACRAPASVKSASETSGKRWTRDFSKSHCVSCGSERPHISSATSCGAAKSRNGVSQGSRPVLARFAAARTAVACREVGG